MISIYFQGKSFKITVIQAYALNNNAEEAEVERFYDDRQHLLELKPPKDVLFIIGDWNAKVRSQEILGVRGKGQSRAKPKNLFLRRFSTRIICDLEWHRSPDTLLVLCQCFLC